MISANHISFNSHRLKVLNWRAFKNETTDLAKAIKPITTDAVMITLPSSWRSVDTQSSRIAWIEDREKESICLAVCHKKSEQMLGLLLLTQLENSVKIDDIRVGYLIAEEFWGQGFASELISGFCSFIEESGLATTITGGVDPSNIGSVKVLTKNGFVKDPEESNNNIHFYKYSCNS